MFRKLSVAIALALTATRVSGVAVWGQCGGIGWTGSTVCDAGTTWCQPGAAPPPPTTSAPSSPTTTSSPPGSTPPPVTPSTCSTTPATVAGFNNAKLPDPFTFNNGSKVTTAADWACRRNEIFSNLQAYESGTLPGPPTSVTGSFSGNSLTVTVTDQGKTISFASTITFPSGTAPAAGWPLVIAYGGGSIPIPAGIATLNFNNDNIAQQVDTSSRGKGLFYNLYGSGHSASAMTAWAWGVSRIIDALEETPAAKINTKKIAVTGCSRNGKGALMAGALEPRIALTIPQESGSGGDACWRLSLSEIQQGNQVQDAREIVTENVWFSSSFNQYVNNLAVLPFDHHSLAALVAPRPLISFENTDYVWLSPMSSFGCMTAAHTVFQALGVPDYHGFAQVGGHAHCAWPSSLTPQLNAFFNRFLLDQSANTNVFTTNNQFGNAKWTASDWINWSTPTLN
ncbi:hypothetical protein K474DRAFT_1686880 [Panus rudis PR-1116 ss-1]|nr:hypothetical protein K474DRAFT_1686880 [Panus rudis PR-1116 ss-1]